MKFIEFDKSLCDSCYKCLRVCPTKAISFNGSEREVIDNLCIKCGLCQAHCPQQALTIKNLIKDVIDAIQSDRKTIVSIAPSYVGAFEMDHSDRMAGALKALGFDHVEETSLGAEIVSQNYEALLKDCELENVITSCCPAANYYIESHYPELLPYLMPVVSPMVAHGRYIKKRYSDNCYAVFIGPCLAKMAEAGEMTGAIDAVITFNELQTWFEKENIVLNEQPIIPFDEYGTKRSKGYPINVNDAKQTISARYRHVKVDGINQCTGMLDELKNNAIKNCCIEINVCEGGCLNGPEMPNNKRFRYQREMALLDHINDRSLKTSKREITGKEINVSRGFSSRREEEVVPDQASLDAIMRQMGKYSKHEELNCGACGYRTCREKAIAVHYGRSDINNCMAYLRDKAESMHSNMIESSPNAVCTIDHDLIITEFNPSFDEIFNDKKIKITGMPIGYFVDETLARKVMESKKSVRGQKVYDDYVKKFFIINIIYYEPEDMALLFFTDITTYEINKKELENVKRETLAKTQEVIDKQMRVAQEIAGLLGETTAETKMGLMSLRDLLVSEDDV